MIYQTVLELYLFKGMVFKDDMTLWMFITLLRSHRSEMRLLCTEFQHASSEQSIIQHQCFVLSGCTLMLTWAEIQRSLQRGFCNLQSIAGQSLTHWNFCLKLLNQNGVPEEKMAGWCCLSYILTTASVIHMNLKTLLYLVMFKCSKTV